MPSTSESNRRDLEELGQRLAALEKELAAARAQLATARDVSWLRRHRRSWLAATMMGGFMLAVAVLPAWRASAQGPSTPEAQVRDLTKRVVELENLAGPYPVQTISNNLSERIRKISNRVDEVSERVDYLEDLVPKITEQLVKDIAKLTSRVDALEAQPPGTRAQSLHIVKAPFTVVDEGGGAIFQVLDANENTFRGAFVFNKSNKPVASMEVNPQGVGAVRARASEGQGAAVLYAQQGDGGVLRIRSDAGTIAAEVTQTGMQYFGSGGNATALSALTEFGGRGVVAVYSKGGTQLAFLTESDKAGGGNVTLTDPGGSGVFSAGYTGGGANACLDTPKQGLKCFGIGLPMTMAVPK